MRQHSNRTVLNERRDSSRYRHIGFTLIEMLVVTAIIALLISILLPSLREARYKAKLTACQANLHDLANAINIYATDHDPFFPPTPYIGSTRNVDFPQGDDNMFVLWHSRYAKDVASWSCPATPYRVRRPDSVVKKKDVNGIKYEITTNKVRDLNDFERVAQLEDNHGFGTSYEYNPWYAWYSRDSSGSQIVRRTLVNWYYGRQPFHVDGSLKTLKITSPTPQFLFLMHEADEGGRVIGVGSLKDAENNRPEPWDNHGARGMNGLFVDGHVEFIPRLMLEDRTGKNRLWERQNRYDR